MSQMLPWSTLTHGPENFCGPTHARRIPFQLTRRVAARFLELKSRPMPPRYNATTKEKGMRRTAHASKTPLRPTKTSKYSPISIISDDDSDIDARDGKERISFLDLLQQDAFDDLKAGLRSEFEEIRGKTDDTVYLRLALMQWARPAESSQTYEPPVLSPRQHISREKRT